MASLSIPTATSTLPVSPAPVPPAPPVGAVAAALPAVLMQQAEAEALPASQPAPGPAHGGTYGSDMAPGQDGAAMRPDQVVLARQLAWPSQDGAALAANWRGMVRGYGTQVAAREQLERDGHLPTPLLLSGQDPRQLRQADAGATPLDAWRFTVHAGSARDQHLRVIDADEQAPRQGQQKRRRGRAALRMELVLDDGATVTVQALPVADGVRMEWWAPDARTAARLRWLQPELEAAVERAGLRVVSWTLRETAPEGALHARLPTSEAAEALTLSVFRAMAELALLLPLGSGKAG